MMKLINFLTMAGYRVIVSNDDDGYPLLMQKVEKLQDRLFRNSNIKPQAMPGRTEQEVP